MSAPFDSGSAAGFHDLAPTTKRLAAAREGDQNSVLAPIWQLIDGTEPGAAGVLALCRRALDLRAGAPAQRREGRRIAAVFANPSLRTRASMAAAAAMLGADISVIDAGAGAWQLEYRDGVTMDGTAAEHVRDAAQVLSHYHDLVAVRAFAGMEDAKTDRADLAISGFARHVTVPLLSMESARWHPLQGLADASTWLDHLGSGSGAPSAGDDLRGVPLTLTWAPHPKALGTAVGHQVLLTGALLGMDVTVAHPPGFDLDPEVVQRAAAVADSAGGAVRVEHDQHKALRGARVVVAKSWGGWSGYGRRDEEAVERAKRLDWRVDSAKMALTDRAGFMHCLPVRRNVVVTDEVIDGPDSWVHETSALRMWTAIATLEAMLSR